MAEVCRGSICSTCLGFYECIHRLHLRINVLHYLEKVWFSQESELEDGAGLDQLLGFETGLREVVLVIKTFERVADL